MYDVMYMSDMNEAQKQCEQKIRFFIFWFSQIVFICKSRQEHILSLMEIYLANFFQMYHLKKHTAISLLSKIQPL